MWDKYGNYIGSNQGASSVMLNDYYKNIFNSSKDGAYGLSLPNGEIYDGDGKLMDVPFNTTSADTPNVLKTTSDNAWSAGDYMKATEIGLGGLDMILKYPMMQTQHEMMKENLKGAKFMRTSMQDRQNAFNNLGKNNSLALPQG